MTKLTLPSGKYGLVAVQTLDTSCHLATLNREWHVVENRYGRVPVDIPTGISDDQDASILGLASAITEDVAAGIVECKHFVHVWYRDYEKPEYFDKTAVDSLHSLVRSQGREPENTLIIKIEE